MESGLERFPCLRDFWRAEGVPQRRASGRGGRAGKGYDALEGLLAARARLALYEGRFPLLLPQLIKVDS